MAVTGARVTVTDEATAIVGDDTNTMSTGRTRVRNEGGATIDLGGLDVASGAGYELADHGEIEVLLIGGDTLYGIAASGGSVEIQVLECGD